MIELLGYFIYGSALFAIAGLVLYVSLVISPLCIWHYTSKTTRLLNAILEEIKQQRFDSAEIATKKKLGLVTLVCPQCEATTSLLDNGEAQPCAHCGTMLAAE